MAAPSQPFRSTAAPSQQPYNLSLGAIGSFHRDNAMKPVGTPFGTTQQPVSQVAIHRLPIDTTEEKLRLMVVFSQELVDVEMLSPDMSEYKGYRSALLSFKTPAGAKQAKDMLHGKSISNDAEMIVEILHESPVYSRQQQNEKPAPVSASSSTSSSSTGSMARSPQRFNGAFGSIDKIAPPSGGAFGGKELPNPDASAHYRGLFSPQSPIGNHLTERPRISSKTLISHDEDDETRELLKDPVAYAENGATRHRRATAPQLPITQLTNLALNTTTASKPQYGHNSALAPMSAHSNAMSPTVMNNAYQAQYPRHNFPPVNPADQNPPCNTLYVGNLPIDTSEEELKAMFSKQRGYKRLCFRTKQNGPMCFVEFEDVSFATKALYELYGHPLHNSVKGGIRLSFSKNPLGVRSGQAPAQTGTAPSAGLNNMVGPGNPFTSANGPPPGLAAPPGLNRLAYGGISPMSSGTNTPYAAAAYSNVPHNSWNGVYNQPMSAGMQPTLMTGAPSGYPSYMMGR